MNFDALFNAITVLALLATVLIGANMLVILRK